MTVKLEDKSSHPLRVTALEKLDNAVRAALTNIDEDQARKHLSAALADCAATDAVVAPQVLACVEAADEHLAYGERMEARTLLTVAHRLFVDAHRPVLLPRQPSRD